jgi:hypothetical protein
MRVTTPEEASEAFGRYLALQRQATNLKEAVSAFAAIHGPVECRGATGQYDLTTQRTWPLFKVLEVLTAHGVMEPSFSVSATTLQTYLKTKKHAAIGRDLEPLAFTKHGNRFNVKYRQPDKHADPVQTEEAAD